MRRLLLLILAATVMGCGSSTPEPSNPNSGSGEGLRVVPVILPDGRTIFCVLIYRGISCDWGPH